jgi:hypothetical protein
MPITQSLTFARQAFYHLSHTPSLKEKILQTHYVIDKICVNGGWSS